MTKTEIEWADEVWNPTTGCDTVSPGCDHCYARTMAKRLKGMGSAKYQTDGDPRTSGPGFGVAVHPDTLTAPLTWRKPRKVFVNSMSDLFHKGVTDSYITSVFAVMAACPQHTFQVLTKRPARMRALLGDDSKGGFADRAMDESLVIKPIPMGALPHGDIWPLPNVWLGVSTETQQWANIRIPALLETPAAVRFLSCEPLLGPVDLSWWLDTPLLCGCGVGSTDGVGCSAECMEPEPSGISWVIAGGESGGHARPMSTEWAQALRDQCTAARVPYFFKQWGAWIPGDQLPGGRPPLSGEKFRLLDGREWNEFPEVAA